MENGRKTLKLDAVVQLEFTRVMRAWHYRLREVSGRAVRVNSAPGQ